MPEDGYANLEEALVSPTLDELRRCKAGVEYKEPEELKRLVRGISSRDLLKNGRMLVFSAKQDDADKASKLETAEHEKMAGMAPGEVAAEQHQQEKDARESIWGCSVFCRVVPGVWVLVSHCGKDGNYLASSILCPPHGQQETCIWILELDEDTWFAPLHEVQKGAPLAVFSGLDRQGRKKEECRLCIHHHEEYSSISADLPAFHAGTKVFRGKGKGWWEWGGLMLFGPLQGKGTIAPAEEVGRMLAFTEHCIAKGVKLDAEKCLAKGWMIKTGKCPWYQHDEASDHDDCKMSCVGRKAWRVRKMERWWLAHWLLDKQRPWLHAEEIDLHAGSAPNLASDKACSQPTDGLKDDPLEGTVFLMAFVAGCALWKIHKQRIQAVRKEWQNLIWNGLDLMIFAAWTAMYLGYVVSKDRASFIGICGLINATGMWIFAGGLVQAWEHFEDGKHSKADEPAAHDRVAFWVLAGLLPLAVLLPLALLTKGSSNSVAIAVGVVLTHLLMISVSKRVHHAWHDMVIWIFFLVLEGLAELVAWKLLTRCSWAVLSMMMLGHIGSGFLVDVHERHTHGCDSCLDKRFGESSKDAKKGAASIVQLARLAPQLLIFADMPACDGPAASLTTQFLATMVATMSGIMVLRALMPHKASTAWKVPHQQRAARRQDWLDATNPAEAKDAMPEIENVNVWSSADLHRKVQDKEAKKHLVAELLYDCAQVAVMSWVESNISLVRSDFTGKLAVDFLNWMSTGVDILMMKGPQAFVKSGLPPNPIVDMVIEAIEDADAAENIE